MFKDFELFVSKLSETNVPLNSLVDFKKVIKNVSLINLKLNQLNYLIGHSDIKKAIEEIFVESPKTFEVLDIIIALRTKNSKKVLNDNKEIVSIQEYYKNPETIYNFIKETGIEKLLINKDINNFVDYVIGIEVGLDTNTRKNRTGKIMQNEIALLFKEASISYKLEVISETLNLKQFNGDLKRFDFVIETKKRIYLIEVNYYNSGGSKLNEVARSYMGINSKINVSDDYTFVWITDGIGWKTAKSKLEEAYKQIEHVYNLNSIKNFIEMIKGEL